ncbi:mitochondrial folate transporter/carrier isoform X3 [Ceratina calcarata]|uniref:Solute carrier family 25 member 32 n=1 Tax=Ceratina calcarata TaxID=156304 RepID=A0AAJ7S3J8_9HYME|nr:mitochondrial folate transporter/carrier isoform X3 [Ceratina calcarata]
MASAHGLSSGGDARSIEHFSMVVYGARDVSFRCIIESRSSSETEESCRGTEICRRVDVSAASVVVQDASGFFVDGSIANEQKQKQQQQQQELVTENMSAAMKSSTTPANSRVLPMLSHFRYEHFVAGISGGVVSTLMLHPLDLIKTRFAVNDGHSQTRPQYLSLKSAVVQIVRTEGLKGLYRGVTPNVLGSGGAWGCYFFFYNTIKTWIQGGNSKKPLGASMHMFAAADAGILTLVITNPLWVVKTRLCLQYMEDKNLPETLRYNGMADAIRKIYRTEGVRGLYRGFVPGIFGVSHGAIQFMVYEDLKNRYNQYLNVPIDTKMSTMEYIFFAAVSKLIAAATTYPYQVIRARLQDHHHHYDGTCHCIKSIWRSDGFKGFYRGLSPYLIHVTPNICLIIVIYETFANTDSDSNQ